MPVQTRQRSRGALDRSLLSMCLILLGIFVLYPSLLMVWTGFSQWDWSAVTDPIGREAIRNTILISLASVATAGVVGTGLAFLLTRYRFPGRAILAAMAYLPFTLPPLVGVLGFYYLIGIDGFLDKTVEYLCENSETVARLFQNVDDAAIVGAWGILLIHTYSFYVFFYAMVSAALETMDVSQLEAARTLGASRLRVFIKVTLPMLRPALLGASLLTFMTSGASFSAPKFFGQGFNVLSVQIFEAQNQRHLSEAYTLTVVLACIAFAGVILFRSRAATGGVASKGVRVPLRSRSGRILAPAFAWSCMAVLLLPHATIIYLSFVDHPAWGREIFPHVFTLDNYASLFRDSENFIPIRNSLWMSVFATGLTLMVGLPAGYLIARKRRGGNWVNILVMIPWALPGTVIAINMIIAFSKPGFAAVHAVWMLPFAYFVRSVPLFTRMATAAIEPFDASLIEAGRSLGASRTFCFYHIVLPLLAPAVVAAAALVFATSLGEYVASVMLYQVENKPISMQISEAWRGSGIGAAFAYSVFLMLLVGATFLSVRRFSSRVI